MASTRSGFELCTDLAVKGIIGLGLPEAIRTLYPDISDAERQELIDIVTEMVETEQWATAVERNRWKESVLTGEEFGEFLDVEQARITGILEELGLV